MYIFFISGKMMIEIAFACIKALLTAISHNAYALMLNAYLLEELQD